MLLTNFSLPGKKGKLGKSKVKPHPPIYHLDLPLEGPVEDALNIRKQSTELDFPETYFDLSD